MDVSHRASWDEAWKRYAARVFHNWSKDARGLGGQGQSIGGFLPAPPEAEILLFTHTGPTSAVVASVYPNEDISKKATASRNARMDKAAHRRKSAEMHQGEVILKLVR